MSDQSKLDERCVNTIRFLSIDAIQKAKSGHPGMPMGAAAMAYVLWQRHMKHNPADTSWPDRDRFILSAGHGSMLLYALLHLTGYDLPMAELQAFRAKKVFDGPYMSACAHSVPEVATAASVTA